jgi:hypothetical protein
VADLHNEFIHVETQPDVKLRLARAMYISLTGGPGVPDEDRIRRSEEKK